MNVETRKKWLHAKGADSIYGQNCFEAKMIQLIHLRKNFGEVKRKKNVTFGSNLIKVPMYDKLYLVQ